MLTLKPYQRAIVRYVQAHRRCAVWAFMGAGKTVSVLTALDHLALTEPTFPALIIAPVRVARSVWPVEIKKWPHLRHLHVSPILGSARQRAAALAVEADVYTINYENIPWLVAQLNGAWPFRTIVADESSRLRGFRSRQGGKRARALATAAFRSQRFVCLSGTPAANGLVDLWGQTWFLDRGERLGRTFGAFQERWFRSIQVGPDAFAVKLEPYPHAAGEINDKLRDICTALKVEQYFELNQPIVTLVPVTLPPTARRQYRQMERELYVALRDETVTAANAAVKSGKLLQLANGVLYREGGGFAVIHDAKLEALESIIAEAAGAPLLVAYHFKADLERLLTRFPYGRVLDQKPATLDQWNAGEIPLLFAHPKSCGHGLNLQDGGQHLVFFGLDWGLEDRLQMIERIGPARQMQAGHPRPVYLYYIVAEHTLDAVVIARVDNKHSVLTALLTALQAEFPPAERAVGFS